MIFGYKFISLTSPVLFLIHPHEMPFQLTKTDVISILLKRQVV
jgi:hypothetical protein